MRQLKLFNTLTRNVDPFSPLSPTQVKLYCCGPTVYNFQHIGNLRTYIFEDILVRTLRSAGYSVDHVMNITDVGHLVGDGDVGEDKMAVAMKREKKRSHEIAEYYTGIFFQDCAKLHITRPNTVCNATGHIQEMIDLILRLEKNGCTYVSGGNVYFDISKSKDYGKLAKLDLVKLEAGARIEVDKNKRNAHDFVLWFTNSKFNDQELQWDSPWGRGYPGWHIECSAMSMKYLGEEFDIHCGGIDHIPVHHTNEIAQSEGATGKSWVTTWMHGGFLVSQSREKMSKSTGGFICLRDVSDKGINPLAYRFLCLGTHYRSELAFSWEALTGAAQSLEKLTKSVLAVKDEAKGMSSSSLSEDSSAYQEKFFQCMAHDLNSPQALAVLWGLVNDKKLPAGEKLAVLYSMDQVLGLDFESWRIVAEEIPSEVLSLVAERDAVRKAKNFARSDEIRTRLKELGYTVEDTPQGGKPKKL